jgi:hypothetical protein
MQCGGEAGRRVGHRDEHGRGCNRAAARSWSPWRTGLVGAWHLAPAAPMLKLEAYP